jgi:hypothetical protein
MNVNFEFERIFREAAPAYFKHFSSTDLENQEKQI